MKYIVDNLPNQQITGELMVNGTLKVTDGTYSIATYRALLTQTGTFSATQLPDLFGYSFIIGETYTIDNYVEGDDFTNIGATGNATGNTFSAVGEIPNNWTSGSQITSSGNLVVDVLENTLGFDLEWSMNPFGSSGNYVAINRELGPIYNMFPKNKTSVLMSNSVAYYGPVPITYFSGAGSITSKDDVIFVGALNWDVGPSDDTLYYTTIEIKIKQNIDETPISITATVTSYPFSYVAINIYSYYSGDISGARYVESIYTEDSTITVNNADELVDLLNNDIFTSYLGQFVTNDLGEVILNTTERIKQQFSPTGTMMIDIFND
jgi:hypothetical protein